MEFATFEINNFHENYIDEIIKLEKDLNYLLNEYNLIYNLSHDDKSCKNYFYIVYGDRQIIIEIFYKLNDRRFINLTYYGKIIYPINEHNIFNNVCLLDDNNILIGISYNYEYALIKDQIKNNEFVLNIKNNTNKKNNNEYILSIGNFTLCKNLNIINLEDSKLIVYVLNDEKYAIKKPNFNTTLFFTHVPRGDKFIDNNNYSFNMQINNNSVIFYITDNLTNTNYRWKNPKFIGFEDYKIGYSKNKYQWWGVKTDTNSTIIFEILKWVIPDYSKTF